MRTAANRAYLAAYHCCKPLQDRLPHAFSEKRSEHVALMEDMLIYSSSDRDTMIAVNLLGKMFQQALATRVKADYRLNEELDPKRVESLIAIAEKIRLKPERLRLASL